MCKSATNKNSSASAAPPSLTVDKRGFKSDGKHWASSYDPYDPNVKVNIIGASSTRNQTCSPNVSLT